MEIWLHNIGPIRDARVDLSPLTVLIGPNGSGKTTLTNVVYALWLSHRTAVGNALRTVDNPFIRTAKDLRGPALVSSVIDKWLESWRDSLEFELRRCCAPELDDLRRARRGGKGAGPRIGVSTPTWSVVFRLDRPELEIDSERTVRPAAELDLESDASFEDARNSVEETLLGGMPANARYLPAGRSGIVHSQAALGRLMSSAISGGWFADATIGTIPGATADLMQMIAQVDPGSKSKRRPASPLAEAFEQRLVRGKIRLDVDGERRRMYFAPHGQEGREWEIQNMATSVAELAPLVLYLRHQNARGDALIIDEPEAHLHPENQVALAELLVELSTDLHPLIVATHSEFLVSALSNQMLRKAKAVDPQEPPIAIYEFRFHDPSDRGYGVDVERHFYDPAEGFEITQFSGVASRVFDDSIDLYNALHAEA